MNNILISNPFLFRPGTTSQEEEDLNKATSFYTYSKSQFEQAWDNFSEEFEESLKTDSSSKKEYRTLFSPLKRKVISSPTITSTTEIQSQKIEQRTLEDLFPMDLDWASNGAYGLGELSESCPEIEETEPWGTDNLSLEEKKGADHFVESISVPSLGTIDAEEFQDFLSSPSSSELFLSIFGAEEEKEKQMAYKDDPLANVINNNKNKPSATATSGLNQNSTITLNSLNLANVAAEQRVIINSLGWQNQQLDGGNYMGMMTPPSTETTGYLAVQQENTPASAPALVSSGTRGLHQRKPILGHRLVAPSPVYTGEENMEAVEKKPDISTLALGNNNGQQRRQQGVKTRRSSSSINNNNTVESSRRTSTATPVAVKNERKRKYESDEVDDPTVRNAKAAKMNREKKKHEMEQLKQQVALLEESNKGLVLQVEQVTSDREKYEELYKQEKEKNTLSDGIGREMTTVKRILEACVPALNQEFKKTMTVQISESFNIPAVLREDGRVEMLTGISHFGQENEAPHHHHHHDSSLTEDSFNILDPDYQMQEHDGEGTYTTVHISPEKGLIKVDYNPHFY